MGSQCIRVALTGRKMLDRSFKMALSSLAMGGRFEGQTPTAKENYRVHEYY